MLPTATADQWGYRASGNRLTPIPSEVTISVQSSPHRRASRGFNRGVSVAANCPRPLIRPIAEAGKRRTVSM